MIRTLLIATTLLSSSVALGAGPSAPTLARLDQQPLPATDTSERPETLVGRHRVLKHNGWYVGPSLGSTMINGNIAANIGVKAAWLANHSYGLGLAAYGFGWNGRTEDNPTLRSDRRLNGGYGGVLFQYILFPNRMVHGLIDATVGGGFVCTRLKVDDDDECQSGRGFFMVAPTMGFEINVTDFMRAGASGGYRFAAAETRDGVSGTDLGGFIAVANVTFGQF